jgi:hypothetical protein
MSICGDCGQVVILIEKGFRDQGTDQFAKKIVVYLFVFIFPSWKVNGNCI